MSLTLLIGNSRDWISHDRTRARIRMCVAKDELEMLLKHRDICASPVPIIFFANKMDIPGALTPFECSQQLELDRISDRPWHIA